MMMDTGDQSDQSDQSDLSDDDIDNALDEPPIDPSYDANANSYEPDTSVANDVTDDVDSNPNTPEKQVRRRIEDAQLAQIHAQIKACATIPSPAFQELRRMWPERPFDVRIPVGFSYEPIHLFELFFTNKVFDILAQNTNSYAELKGAQCMQNKPS